MLTAHTLEEALSRVRVGNGIPMKMVDTQQRQARVRYTHERGYEIASYSQPYADLSRQDALGILRGLELPVTVKTISEEEFLGG